MNPEHAEYRRRDLRLTAVMFGLWLTPAWLTPAWFARPWLVLCIVLVAPALWWSWRHAPWVPTPTEDMPHILAALALQPTEHFCDLGAGDGRMITRVHAATGAWCTGVEGVPLLWAMAWMRTALHGRCSARLGDLYRADLSTYDAVYVWGTEYGSPRFTAMLKASLRPGARVVSYSTPLVDWAPSQVLDGGRRPVYRYEQAPAPLQAPSSAESDRP